MGSESPKTACSLHKDPSLETGRSPPIDTRAKGAESIFSMSRRKTTVGYPHTHYQFAHFHTGQTRNRHSLRNRATYFILTPRGEISTIRRPFGEDQNSMRRRFQIAASLLAITTSLVIAAISCAEEAVTEGPPAADSGESYAPQGHDFSQFGDFRTAPGGDEVEVPGWVHDGGEFQRQRIYERFGFYHSHPDDPARHQGVGRPLYGTSWRNRPYHFDYLFGVVETNDLQRNEVLLRSTILQGFRLGYDFDHYWGTEIRFAFGDGKLAYASNPLLDGSAQLMMFDTNLLYYPWGDSVWRPYATVGLGATYYGYDDVNGVNRDQTNFSIPIGIGLKHFFRPWLAFRCELMDNIATGSGSVPTTHNFSFTTGIEYRFGGSRWSYTR
ncbi:hypothetical protein C5Y97_13105 [Blastopirellula marina]|uniref:Outer membrane protein beta-barrel domain-containing protein n=1 Tax=Blastopirellula marina TaxID=124 RepID=A0A2S8FTT1_9BACT|nr:hypothetical protein C5Y98_13095 [Blastopirellula marina]PTL44216.1 hypothetical protein C5Y97_13105 [Blastopirellula marina]